MKTNYQNQEGPKNINGKSTAQTLAKQIWNKISALFEPEEVEVTFKEEGRQISYTYTKVEHKQVA